MKTTIEGTMTGFELFLDPLIPFNAPVKRIQIDMLIDEVTNVDLHNTPREDAFDRKVKVTIEWL